MKKVAVLTNQKQVILNALEKQTTQMDKRKIEKVALPALQKHLSHALP
ncbi:conserved hypothetical protein [Vibrio jasicida]|nr:conserved hypothetical protein [Vibrio jasicida]